MLSTAVGAMLAGHRDAVATRVTVSPRPGVTQPFARHKGAHSLAGG